MATIPATDFESLFEAVPGLYLLLAPDLTIKSVSDAYIRATLTERFDITGRNIFDVFPDKPGDSTADGVSKLNASLNFVLEHGVAHEMPVQKYDIRMPDGSYTQRYWKPLNIPVFDKAKKLMGIIHNVVDVTEKRNSEVELNFLASIASNLHDPLICSDNSQLITRWNEAAQLLLGWKSSEVTGKDISSVLKADYPGENRKTILHALEQKGVWKGEVIYYTKSGLPLNVISTVSRLKDQDGVITGNLILLRDITAVKKARLALGCLNLELEQRVEERTAQIIRSEENLKAIFENASEGFVLTDAGGAIKALNARAADNILLNYSAEMEPGKNLFDFIEEGRKEIVEDIFRRVLSGDTIEYDRLYKSTGSPDAWINFIFNPVRTGELISGVCITGRDVTETKMAEKQREFAHNNLTALINNTGDLMWSVDRDLKLITFNDAFGKVIELTTGFPIAKGISIISGQFTKDQGLRYKKHYARALAGETFTIVDHFEVPEEFWSEISFYPIRQGTAVIGTACFSRDITQNKKAAMLLEQSFREKLALAERMSSVINTLPANIALLDKKGFIVDVNRAWLRFAEENCLFSAHDSIGENYLNILEGSSGMGAEDSKKVAKGIKSVLSGAQKEFIMEYTCPALEPERWFNVVVTPLHEREQSGAVVMHIDISALRKLERERLGARMGEQKKLTLAILQGQEKERNHLGRELHDNINQILAATRMFLSIAAKKNEILKEAIKYPMELLDSSIDEIRTLCRNMVTPLKNIHLQELIADLLAKLGQDKSIRISFTYAVPAGCLSDELKLHIFRILQELVSNIMKYAAATRVTVSLKEKDNILKVTASDNGRGFNVTSKKKGIGISNMINRMQPFNGTVDIKSSEGNGCKTTITVPC